MEERIVESREAYPTTHIPINTVIEKEMSDGSWMARNQLMKPVQVSQVDWTTTQARNTNLIDLAFPLVLGQQESLVLRTLRMYAFYKLAPCFRVQINATVFHQGQLICSFDPFNYCGTNPFVYTFSHIYATGLPNVKIMASYSDAIELKIPFIHPRSYLTTNTTENFNTMGNFRITVLNPLLAAEGASSSLSVTTWIYAIDAQVHVPIQDHTPILDYQAPPQLEETSLISDAIGKGKDILNTTTDIFGNIVSGNIGQALRKGQGLIDKLGDIFGFDYPARTLQPSKTISPIENLSVSKGVSQSQRLALDPFSLHQLTDDIASESLEAMGLKTIIQMPMLHTQFLFTSTNARGTLLKTILVNPCVSPVYQDSIQRSYLSYVSNGFLYWSGGIVYDIEIVATKFHSGKLIFAYVPNVSTPPTYVSVSDSLPNVIVDIQQSSTTRFIVPFTSSTPMKNTFMPTEDSLSNIADSAIGVLTCYVQNTLAFASNVAPSVEINIYVSASSDFSLYVPQRPVVDRLSTLTELEETSLLLNTNKNEAPETTTVLSYNQNFTIPRHHFGEDFSLLDLIKRFSPCATYTININNNFGYMFIPISPTLYSFEDNNSSVYLSYWSKLYSCWSGSLRYKFIARVSKNQTASIQIVHLPTLPSAYIPSPEQVRDSNILTDFGGFGMVRTQLSQDCALEVELPYYSKYNMLFTTLSLTTALIPNLYDMSANGQLALVMNTSGITETAAYVIDSYIAAGDDFRLVYVRSPPSDRSNTIFTITTLA